MTSDKRHVYYNIKVVADIIYLRTFSLDSFLNLLEGTLNFVLYFHREPI